MPEKDWRMDGKVFSLSEIVEIVESLDFSDEIRFSFSGGNYQSLKEHIETHAGSESGSKYRVFRIIDVSNVGDKLNKEYTVCIKRVPS